MSSSRFLRLSLLSTAVISSVIGVSEPAPAHAASLVTNSEIDFSTQQGYKRWHYLFEDENGNLTELVPGAGNLLFEAPDGSTLTATGGTLTAGSSTTLTRRWVSHLKGEILVNNIFEPDIFADLQYQVSWNRPGEAPIFLTPAINGDGGTGSLTFEENLDVQVGDTIDITISGPDLEENAVFSTQTTIESKSLGGMSFVDSREGEIQPPEPANCNGLIPFNLTSFTASTIGSFVRSAPCFQAGATNLYELPQGTPISLDAWTAGGETRYYDLPGTPDDPDGTNVWYRLAGTNEWISASIVTSPLPDLPTFDYDVQHIGLRLDDTIQEAYRAYTEGGYWDPITQKLVVVPNLGDGVIDKHSPGSFQHRSPAISSPVKQAKYAVVSEEDADAMANLIDTLVGKPYLDNAPCPVADTLEQLVGFIQTCLITPFKEKGGEGQYTAAGLLEHSAEITGAGEWDPGVGFIPGHLEITDQTNAESIIIDEVLVQTGPTFVTTPIDPTEMSVITPWLLFGSVSGEIVHSERWIQGILESVNGFVLVAPNKTKLGYLSSSLDLSEFSIFDGLSRDTLFNNIQGGSLNITDYVGSSTKNQPIYDHDDSCEDPDLVEKVFQFHVSDRQETGRYELWIFGRNKNSKAYVGTESVGRAIYLDCSEEPITIDPTKVPEPSLVFGFFSVLLSLGIVKRRGNLIL
jgi:hypothetical protein